MYCIIAGNTLIDDDGRWFYSWLPVMAYNQAPQTVCNSNYTHNRCMSITSVYRSPPAKFKQRTFTYLQSVKRISLDSPVNESGLVLLRHKLAHLSIES